MYSYKGCTSFATCLSVLNTLFLYLNWMNSRTAGHLRTQVLSSIFGQWFFTCGCFRSRNLQPAARRGSDCGASSPWTDDSGRSTRFSDKNSAARLRVCTSPEHLLLLSVLLLSTVKNIQLNQPCWSWFQKHSSSHLINITATQSTQKLCLFCLFIISKRGKKPTCRNVFTDISYSVLETFNMEPGS